MKLAVWNMEWLNDLVDSSAGALKPNDRNVRGPRPPWKNEGPTVAERITLLREGLADLDPDILLIVEGPDRTEDMEILMAAISDAEWVIHIQRSRFPSAPDNTRQNTSTQCVGIALRTDRQKFADTPMTTTDVEDPAAGLIHLATEPFFLDHGADKVPEWFRYERRPLWVTVHPAQGSDFNIMGLHLKSKGIFAAYEWSRWWQLADANRMRLLAQCRHIREAFLDVYLSDPTALPLIVAGDINDGPGFDTSEMRLNASGVETLMGSVWKPDLCLGNALFDALDDRDRARLNFSEVTTTRFADPIFNDTYHRVMIDHILYSRNTPGWVAPGEVPRKTAAGTEYWKISDHFPVVAEITPPSVGD